MAYQPIQNYGIIGNMRTAALAGMNGSIDWLCCPYFDSPSVFAAMLDDDKGGRFQIAWTQDGINSKQFYWPETNVLITRFLSQDGVGEIEDFMPAGLARELGWHDQLVRRVKVTRGSMEFHLRCHRAFDYARASHETRITAHGATFHSSELSLALSTAIRSRRMSAVSARCLPCRKDKRLYSWFAVFNPMRAAASVRRKRKPTSCSSAR
jgi:GH15 family glucan-1,4-alpha-glucosidase